MRIVTRPDFDGIVCAALLKDALNIDKPVLWIEPGEINNGTARIKKGDILANLPFHKNCSLWFDHHYTNSIQDDFKGEFRIAPSAAGIIHNYYLKKFTKNYSKLVRETDRIDSARLTLEEVLRPVGNPYVMLSFTINSRMGDDHLYWDRIVELLRNEDMEDILNDKEVSKRVEAEIENDRKYKEYLQKYTGVEGNVSVTDFRKLDFSPSGNRFLVFSLFPDTYANLKIRNNNMEKGKVILSIGHSIFNRKCRVHCGKITARFGGGGHFGAGSCCCESKIFDKSVESIISVLNKNVEI
ncbi:MAG: exopolyphosphatase [Acidobacteriota bacterium]